MTFDLAQQIAWIIFVVLAITYAMRTRAALKLNSEAMRLMADSFTLMRKALEVSLTVTTADGDEYETAVILKAEAGSALNACKRQPEKPTAGDVIALNRYTSQLEQFTSNLVHHVQWALAPAGDDAESKQRMKCHPLGPDEKKLYEKERRS